MMQCRQCGDSPATFAGVTSWGWSGMESRVGIVDVPTCEKHTLCPVCNKTMEVSPISLHVECFLHGNELHPRRLP